VPAPDDGVEATGAVVVEGELDGELEAADDDVGLVVDVELVDDVAVEDDRAV
jgi:hypothetical protein